MENSAACYKKYYKMKQNKSACIILHVDLYKMLKVYNRVELTFQEIFMQHLALLSFREHIGGAHKPTT